MKFKSLISIIVLIILVFLALLYLKNNFKDFKQLSVVNPIYIPVNVILTLASYILIGLITLVLLQPLKVNLSTFESFGISVITGFYNLITPFRGGMAVRAVYLKKKHNFPITHFLASLAASYVLIFFIGSLLGMVSMYLIYLTDHVLNWFILAVFAGMFTSLLFIIVFAPRLKETKYPLLNKFISVVNGWHLIRKNASVVMKISILSILQMLIMVIILMLQFKVFGMELSFAKAAYLTAIGGLSLLIQLTPAGLGINEAITVFSASTIGITPAQSLSVAILGRLISVVVLFTLGPLFSYLLMKKK